MIKTMAAYDAAKAALEVEKNAELRQLVESHELVKSYGGIDKAKDFISPYSNEQLNKKVYSPMLRIKQAIADMENYDSYTPMRSR